MKKISSLNCSLVIAAFISLFSILPVYSGNDFKAGNGQFLLNGKPYVIKAAELHYPRIPKEYWDQRIKLTKALGMNTICLYTFWNVHEPKEGGFDFEGQNDIRQFIELCRDNGMNVILRPGPYVCAEWEMGGLPWWLLKKEDIQLRDNDPYFLERVDKFQERLSEEVGDLTIGNGGPILMIQVENEYGSYGENKDYIRNIRDIIKKHYGEDVALFQCDWSSNFTLNGLEDLIWTMNFGTGADIDSQFEELKRLRPESPLMCSEYWSGWFDKWGAAHETRSADEMVKGIDEMLSKDISFSLYMTHGGTNWGHWAGANSPGYSPDVTSYDYDAPINESGQPTKKFHALREVLKKYSSDSLEALPELIRPIAVEKFSFTEVAPLFDNLPEPIHDTLFQSMEKYDMGYGSIMYSTTLPAIEEGTILQINEPHDFAQVFINGNLAGTLDRRNGENQLTLEAYEEGSTLDILVEATGRINFGREIKDFKGITEGVSLWLSPEVKIADLKNGKVYLFPDELDFYNSMKFEDLAPFYTASNVDFPRGVYKATFDLDTVSDTFLDFKTWGKGLVYVNGHGLGRHWRIGPQQALYVPGPWLKKGENEILVFDILGPKVPETEGLTEPVLNILQIDQTIDSKASEGFEIAESEVPVLDTIIKGGNGWKEVKFGKPVKGEYVIIEILGTNDQNNEASIAELELLDGKGNKMSREKWTVSVNTEDRETGNHTADKITDLQESTYWQTGKDAELPYYIKIKLDGQQTVSGLQYLPRMEKGAPGSLSHIKLYVR